MRYEEKSQEEPVLVITKDGQKGKNSITRTEICEQGLIPTSAVYKQTKKVELENDNCDKITVERLDDNQTSCTMDIQTYSRRCYSYFSCSNTRCHISLRILFS